MQEKGNVPLSIELFPSFQAGVNCRLVIARIHRKQFHLLELSAFYIVHDNTNMQKRQVKKFRY